MEDAFSEINEVSSLSEEKRFYHIEDDKVVYYDSRDQRAVVCDASAVFAVGWDRDGDVLLSHGEATAVSARMDAKRKAFATGGFEEMAENLRVAVFPINTDTLAEVNACIETSNRVGRLPERLDAILNGAPVNGPADAHPF